LSRPGFVSLREGRQVSNRTEGKRNDPVDHFPEVPDCRAGLLIQKDMRI
jgi:hypothetical protein